MFGFKVEKETAVEKAEKKLKTILEFAVNYRSSRIVRKMNTMDLVDLYERQQGSTEPVANLISIVIINELNNRFPRAIRTWMEHSKLHMRDVIMTEMRLKEKEAINGREQKRPADLPK